MEAVPISMDSPLPTICYEDLVASYANNLEIQTRGFSAGFPWLESWVPDDELIPSLANLLEAAQIGGMDAICVEMDPDQLDGETVEGISKKLSHLASLTTSNVASRIRIEFSKLNDSARFSDVRDFYKSKLRDRYALLKFTNAPASDAVTFENTDGKFWFVVGDEQKPVEAAGFVSKATTPPSLSSAMDCLCEILLGLPLLEIREHALVRLEHRLRDAYKTPPVQGILLPQNTDPVFKRAKALLDGALLKTGAFEIKDTNFFYPGSSTAWKGLSPEEREKACQKSLNAASEALLGYANGIRVVDARRSFAVTVKFEGTAPVDAKRKAALELEKILRRECDARLEVFCLEMKDASQLRRL